MPDYATAICHSNLFYHLLNGVTKHSEPPTINTSYGNATISYAKSVKSKVGKENLDSHKFWKIKNKIPNRGKL